MSKIAPVVLAGLLIGANALAADAPSSSAPTNPPSTPGPDLESQLQAARQQLEAAAREVAQLSAQLGRSAMAQVQNIRARAVFLGLQLQDGSGQQGATIVGVSPGGPAAEAGLATGDVIVALNGAQISGPNASREVVDRMAAIKPDTKVTVKVTRDGKPMEFQVAPRAGLVEFFNSFDGPGGPGQPGQSVQHFELRRDDGTGVAAVFEGMELADLTPALGEYFGTAHGVLVIRVPHDGEFLKLQDGDVITSIDGRVPENGSHATRILRSYQPGEKIRLKIMRHKKPVDLEGTLPERRHFGPPVFIPRPGPVPPGPGAYNGPQPGPIPPAVGEAPQVDPVPAPPPGHLVPLSR
jgi:S1-C subfamily serine protease